MRRDREGCAIATTSGELAATVLDCFAEAGTDLAILHGEATVAGGDCSSDVDLVARQPAAALVAAARDELHRHDLHPVVIWPYDVGSASVFIVDGHARQGAQFDILHDATGSGHYGIRAAPVLAHSRPGVRWRRAAPEDELLYLIRKRLYKGQQDRVAALLLRASDRSVDRLSVRARQLFSDPSAAVVQATVQRQPPPHDRLRSVRGAVVNSGRLVSRVRHAVGFWVAVTGADARSAAEVVAGRFERVLPAAAFGPAPNGLPDAARRAPGIARVRWRAGVYASWGPVPAPLRADLSVDTSCRAQDDLLAEVVAAMEQRLWR